MIISNHLITGKTKFIAHIGFPTKSFTAPKILNPYFNLINKDFFSFFVFFQIFWHHSLLIFLNHQIVYLALALVY